MIQSQMSDSTSYHRAIEVDNFSGLDNIRIILCQPQGPLNIGSVARAIKGMGIHDLWLVNPIDFLNQKETWYMAHGAQDIIQNCRVVENLSQALDGVHFLVGTTHRRRRRRLAEPISAKQAALEVASISPQQRVAILFGREDKGLTNEELCRCQLTASIPMATKNPSLNLAQAVQIMAYEIFLASSRQANPSIMEYATVDEVEAFYQRIHDLVQKIQVKPINNSWQSFMYTVRRVFSRKGLEARDIAVLDMIFSTSRRYIDRLESQLISAKSDKPPK